MLQDFIQERWAANRPVSPEVWRLVHKYLREDVKRILLGKKLEDLEKKAVESILNLNAIENQGFWNDIGKMNELNMN